MIYYYMYLHLTVEIFNQMENKWYLNPSVAFKPKKSWPSYNILKFHWIWLNSKDSKLFNSISFEFFISAKDIESWDSQVTSNAWNKGTYSKGALSSAIIFHKNLIVEKLLELLLLFTIVYITLRVFIYVFHFTKKEKILRKSEKLHVPHLK